ncbi:MAG TPA: NADH-quinone oxidoreductase subunit N [Candidatus Binataceae bacterium]
MTKFDLLAINFSWLSILPLMAISAAAIAVLLVGVRVDDEESEGLGWLSLAGIAVTFVLTLLMRGQHDLTFSGALALDDYTVYFALAILVTAAIVILLSLDYVPETGMVGAEYYSLILFATLGMLLMAAAGDLIIIFLGLETMSLAIYVLAGFARRDPKSGEAAMKYFILGAFSTGFLLYGIALLYGATGSIKLDAISRALSSPMSSPLLLMGIGMLLIGFGFKVAAVPFHMWTPDAYEGAPTSITAFMAVGVKIAAFAAFLRVFTGHLGGVRAEWNWVLWTLAALTMTAGNLIALVQTNIKRLLAYSAIAHAGYILVGMAAGNAASGAAVMYYLLAYALTNLGAFGVVIALGRKGVPHDLIEDYRGLSTRHPMLAAAMALFLFSLVGVPPLAGFVGKFYIFSAALNAGLVWLVVIAAINTVIAAYYYISVIVAMYMLEGAPAEDFTLNRRPALVAAIAIALIGTVLVGAFPQPYMSAAQTAFSSVLSSPPPTQVSSR